MIDPEAETFIVQRQGDQLMIQRITIERLRVHQGGRVEYHGYDGEVFLDAATVELRGTFAGGGLFDSGEAAGAFVQGSLES